MVRLGMAGAVLALLVACDGSEPAGGRGYFDPPGPAPVTFGVPGGPAPLQTADSGFDATQPMPGTGAPVDDTQRLAQDVTSVLAATAPGQAPAGAQGADGQAFVPGDTGIDPNDDSINLALQTQEQQKRQRAAAAAEREAARQQLVVIQPEPVPQTDVNANVVKFARETTHPVGTKRYNRPAFRDRFQSAATCRRFGSDDEAQRQFLANGGPTTDRFNLDPDGDGFACDFDPEVYRKLSF